MFTLKVVLPLILSALVAPIKADLSSACGFFAIVGSGFDTSSSPFSLFAFTAHTSPEDTTTGTPLGVVSGVLTTVESPASFTLDDGTLSVSGSETAPLLKNNTRVAFTSGSAPASQFCATVSTSAEGGSPLPLFAVNATIDGNFALCDDAVVFRPESSTGCEAVDLRMVV